MAKTAATKPKAKADKGKPAVKALPQKKVR